ncbi:MAG: peroxidase-related enzyme [Devosiaceae bacterium]|nr:peroxidase-related enzyme [Devosiaceae bacterium MH13]
MPRIPTLDLADLPEEFRGPVEIIQKSNGYVPNSYRILAHRPEILAAFMALSKAVIRDDGTLDRGFRFLIAYISSSTAGCNFCQAHNIQSAQKHGISDEKLNAIWEYEDSPHFSDAERAAFNLARAASVVPNVATDADFDELKKHFSNAQIVEIVAVISLFGWLNRFNDTMQTELEEHNLDWAEGFGLHEKTAWDPSSLLPDNVDAKRFEKA